MASMEDIEKKIKDLNIQLIKAKERIQVKCSYCSKVKQIKNVILFQRQWYESPYS